MFTYRDAVDLLVNNAGGNVQASVLQTCRGAVLDAYREICEARRWNYLLREYRINLNAGYSTGTIAFDLTGGANERQLTLTTGTWPSWAAAGRVRIADVIYEVDRRISDSIITLDDINSPTADIAAGTSYELYQDVYGMPEDFLSHDKLLPASNRWSMRYVSPAVWSQLTRYGGGLSVPSMWTIMADPDNLTRMALFLYPAPGTAESLDFIYHRRPQKLTYSGHGGDLESGGTITTSASSTAVTGTGTAFESGMAGSLIRVSRNSQLPTGLEGANPAREELQIRSVTSATALTLESAAVNAATSVKYVISDPVDIDLSMQTAFLRCCEKHFEIRKGGKDVAMRDRLYSDALRLAAGADSRHFEVRYLGEGMSLRPRLAHMPGPDTLDEAS